MLCVPLESWLPVLLLSLWHAATWLQDFLPVLLESWLQLLLLAHPRSWLRALLLSAVESWLQAPLLAQRVTWLGLSMEQMLVHCWAWMSMAHCWDRMYRQQQLVQMLLVIELAHRLVQLMSP